MPRVIQSPEQHAASLVLELQAAGYSLSVAEALAGNNITSLEALDLSTDELHNIWCDWEGLIYCGPSIRDALNNIKKVHLRRDIVKAEQARQRLAQAVELAEQVKAEEQGGNK